MKQLTTGRLYRTIDTFVFFKDIELRTALHIFEEDATLLVVDVEQTYASSLSIAVVTSSGKHYEGFISRNSTNYFKEQT